MIASHGTHNTNYMWSGKKRFRTRLQYPATSNFILRYPFQVKALGIPLSGCKLTLLLAANHNEDEHTLYSLISFRTEVKSSACSCVELMLFLVRWNSWIHDTMHHPKKENMFLEWNQTLQLELRMLDNSNKSKEKLSIPPS